jgi:acyl-homoserine lactone acylase PvdQ
MAPDGENFRGINAVRVLSNENSFTIDKVIAAGYDTYLAAFEKLVPALIKAHENLPKNDSLYRQLSEPIDILKRWDMRCAENSISTTLAVEWGQKLLPKLTASGGEDEYEYVDPVTTTERFINKATTADLLDPLKEVVKELTIKFSTWKVEWGSINRFQRLSADVNLKYNDHQPSWPVAFASSTWGMLPSYATQYFPGTKKRYGVGGNSFICAVEFGKNVKAKSLLAGGQSGDPASKHFNDQAEMYTKGNFKEVLFYKEDVLKHVEKRYHPGE